MKIIQIFLNQYYFVTPLFYSFGNAAEEIYWASARARVFGRKLIILRPMKFTQILNYSICNTELFNLQIGYKNNIVDISIKNIATVYINIIFFLKRSMAIYMRHYHNLIFPEHYFFPKIGKSNFWPNLHRLSRTIDGYKEDPIFNALDTLPAPLLHKKNHNVECDDFDTLIKKVGCKYVCLHVRESGYHNDADKRPYRNASINNYVPAILKIIDSGLSVVRIGDRSMSPCEIMHDQFIDTCNWNKNDYFDLYLIQNCEFYVGMQSGPFDLALLFKKPVLLLNMYDWFFAGPMKFCDRGLLKKIYIPSIGEINSLNGYFRLEHKYTDFNRNIKPEECIFIENTENEILAATIEFLQDYFSGFSRAPSDDLLGDKKRHQEYCYQIIKNSIQLIPGSEIEEDYVISRSIYRVISTLGFLYCSSKLLKKN